MIFMHIPAADTSVDPCYSMLTDQMVETQIDIQDCRSYGGGYVVNEYAPKGTPLDDMWMREVGAATSLTKAQAIAIAYYATRKGG